MCWVAGGLSYSTPVIPLSSYSSSSSISILYEYNLLLLDLRRLDQKWANR